MEKEELNAIAQQMMIAHGLTEVYICSDQQGFTDIERANDHSRYLKDKNVHYFQKESEPTKLSQNSEVVVNTGSDQDLSVENKPSETSENLEINEEPVKLVETPTKKSEAKKKL